MPKTNDKPTSRQLIKPAPGSDTEDKSSKVPAVGDRFVGKRGDWVVTHAEASPGKIRIENQETYDIVFLNLESGLWKAIFFDEDDKRIKASNKSYEKLIRFVIDNYDRELLKFEVSNTGMVQGYLTPFAFAGPVDKKKNKGKYRKGSNYIGTDIKENRGIDMKLNENFVRKLVREEIKKLKRSQLNENANYHYDGDDLYVDSGFLNSAARNALPGFELKHMGFGEFYLAGPGGVEVQFDRTRGKDFPGKSGRSHLVYDNRGGKIISQMMDNVKKKKLANEA